MEDLIIHLFKAEFSRYLAEVRTYFPDQITSMVVTILIFVVFTFLNIDAGNSAFYIGYAYWYLISSIIGEASESISLEKQMGTLDQLLLRPAGLELVLTVKTTVWIIINFIKVFIVLAFIALIFHLNIGFHIGLLLIFFITCIGIFGFSLLLAALTLKYTKTASFQSVISYLLLFLTGSIFPLTQLPEFVQISGRMLPITLGIDLSKQLINQHSVSINTFLLLCVQSLIYVYVGHLAFQRIYRSSKKSGIDNSY